MTYNLRRMTTILLAFFLLMQSSIAPAVARQSAPDVAPPDTMVVNTSDTLYSISGRVVDGSGNGMAGVMVTATASKTPVIFIPGIGGSVLHKPGAVWPLWPNVLEPDDNLATVVGFLLGDAVGEAVVDMAKLIVQRMAGNAGDLVLQPTDNYATTIVAPDVIRWIPSESVKLKDVYGSFLQDFLQSQHGYRPYELTKLPGDAQDGCDLTQAAVQPTLFVFPYDWRLPIERTAQRLANYVDCVRSFYPDTEIDIIAHSMGGLVARRYILDKVNANQPSYVRRMVTMGTPWLGAPKLLYVMLTGDFDFGINLALVKKDVLKHLVAAYPGAHMLLPSEKYLQVAARNIFYGAPLREWGWDLNGNNRNKDEFSYSDYKAWLDAQFAQSTPVTTNETFHKNPGQDIWDGDNSGVEYHHILGSATSTILKVLAREQRTCNLGVCTSTVFWDAQTSPFGDIPGGNFWGDGTVPHPSGEGNKVTPTGTSPVQHFHTMHSLSPLQNYEHGALPTNSNVRSCVIEILNSGNCSIAVNASETAEALQVSADAQYSLLVVGSGSAVVTDSVNNVTGFVENVAMLRNIPNVEYYDTGGNAVRITAPATEPLTVTFKSGDTPLFVEVLKTSEDAVMEAVRYPDLTIPPNTTLALSLPLSESVTSLTMDTTGDGIPDTPVAVTPIVATGLSAADTTPPTVTVTVTTDQVVTIAAEDETGVAVVYYSFDETFFQAYTGTVSAPYTAIAVYAFADDTLANRSSVTTMPLTPDTTPPTTTIQVDGAQDNQGAFTGAVTVTLSAADTQSGVQSTHYSLDGGQSWQPYAALFRIEHGGAAAVHAYSIDAVGNQEAPQVRTLLFAAEQSKVYLPAVTRGGGETRLDRIESFQETRFAVTTDVDGYYSFVDLPPGVYRISANRVGWNTSPSRHIISIPWNGNGIDFSMVPADDLVAYLSFDDSTATDQSNYGNNGMFRNNPASVPGVLGQALRFGGVANPSYIVIPNSPSLSFIDHFTISMWFNIEENMSMDGYGRITEYGNHGFFGKSGDRSGISLAASRSQETGWHPNAVNGRCCGSSGRAISATSGVSLDGWHMLTFTHGQGFVRIFLDGQLQAEMTSVDFNLNPSTAASDIYLGIHSVGSFWYPFNGMLDEVRVFNRALSLDEVMNLYQQVAFSTSLGR